MRLNFMQVMTWHGKTLQVHLHLHLLAAVVLVALPSVQVLARRVLALLVFQAPVLPHLAVHLVAVVALAAHLLLPLALVAPVLHLSHRVAVAHSVHLQVVVQVLAAQVQAHLVAQVVHHSALPALLVLAHLAARHFL